MRVAARSQEEIGNCSGTSFGGGREPRNTNTHYVEHVDAMIVSSIGTFLSGVLEASDIKLAIRWVSSTFNAHVQVRPTALAAFASVAFINCAVYLNLNRTDDGK